MWTRRCALAVLACALLLAWPGVSRAAEEILTNADVVAMTKAHLGTAVIVAQIRDRPGRYALSTRDLVKLKQQGVADEVLLAMQKKAQDGEAAPAAAPEAKAQSDRPKQPPGKGWVMGPATDQLTGASRGLAARLVQRLGRYETEVTVTAVCAYNSSSYNRTAHDIAAEPRIKLTYSVDPGPDGRRRLAWTQPERLYDYYKGYFWVDGHSLPYTQVRVRVDNLVNTLTLEQNLPNSVTVWLPGGSQGAGTVATELVLESGEWLVPEFSPRDPGFRDFAVACYRQEAARLPSHAAIWAKVLEGVLPPELAASASPPASPPPPELPHTPPAPRGPRQGPKQRDGFIQNRSKPPALEGTVETLAAELPGIVKECGMSPEKFAAEMAFVLEAARTCAGVTLEMAQKAPMRPAFEGAKLEREDLSALGEKYAICSPRTLVDVTEKTNPAGARHLWMDVAPLGFPPQWRAGQGFKVKVGFKAMESDADVAEDRFIDAYTAVVAIINGKY